MAKETKCLSLGPPNKTALRTKSFRLMGTTITVTETREGEFESERMFIEKNKHLFKYRGGRDINIKTKSRIVNNQNTPILEVPTNVRNAIEAVRGTGLVFIMSKKLEDSDVKKDQNRLYVPKSRGLMDYITEEEIQRIELQGKNGGLNLFGIDPRGIYYRLNLKLWQSNGSSNKYVLIKDWAKLINDNELEKDDLVELWCFRSNSNLWMAVIAEKKARGGSNVGAGTSGSSNPERMDESSDLGVGTSGVETGSDLGIGTSGVETGSDLGVSGTNDL